MSSYIKVDLLKERMYHEAFEKTTDMQRWDSGCWIRYKMFEIVLASVPTVDVVEQKELDAITEAHERTGYDRGFRDGYAQAIEEAITAVGANTWAGSRITQLQPTKFRERRDDDTN